MILDKAVDLSKRPSIHHVYRFRAWRSAETNEAGKEVQVHAVLMEPTSPACPPPDLYSARAANLVARYYLNFAAGKLAWYERSAFGCFRVEFKRFGKCSLRHTLYSPSYTHKQFDAVARGLGLDPHEGICGDATRNSKETGESEDEDFEFFL